MKKLTPADFNCHYAPPWKYGRHPDNSAVPDDAVFIGGDMYDEAYEHYGAAIFKLSDGTYIAVECGGCSCDEGSWYISDPQPTAEEANRFLSEYNRVDLTTTAALD